MDISLGSTLSGSPVVVKLGATTAVLLVGDTDRGKTTLARYLARWWIAAAGRHLHLVCAEEGEWADLASATTDPMSSGITCGNTDCLLVVDDADRLPTEVLAEVAAHRGATVATTTSGLGVPQGWAERCTVFGLLRGPLLKPTDLAVSRGEARLDWPAHAIALSVDERGPLDFPCHRWAIQPEVV